MSKCALCLRDKCYLSAPPIASSIDDEKVWVCGDCETISMQSLVFVFGDEELPGRYLSWMGDRKEVFIEWARKRNKFMNDLCGW